MWPFISAKHNYGRALFNGLMDESSFANQALKVNTAYSAKERFNFFGF